MKLSKVIISGNYHDYLEGKEVVATILETANNSVSPGEHAMAFKNTIAAKSDVTVPKSEQSHYIGVEGTVTGILTDSADLRLRRTTLVRVQKL